MNKIANQSANSLIIVGGGGFSRETIWAAREAKQPWNVAGILDDSDLMQGKEVCGVKVVGSVSDWQSYSNCQFVVAIGSSRVRRRVVEKMKSIGEPKFATVIHESVRHSAYTEFGEGSIITAGCIITTQVSIGRHVILNLSTTVGHDCIIEDFVTVAPLAAISGNVYLSQGAEVGTGAALKQAIRIGSCSMVGMGAVMTKDLPENQLAVGNPARVVRSLDPL